MDFVPYIERLFPAMLMGINGEKVWIFVGDGGHDAYQHTIVSELGRGDVTYWYQYVTHMTERLQGTPFFEVQVCLVPITG